MTRQTLIIASHSSTVKLIGLASKEKVPSNQISIDDLNTLIVNTLNSAKLTSIPQQNCISGKQSLPDYIIILMKKRKSIKCKLNSCRTDSSDDIRDLKKNNNIVRKVISGELDALENQKWNKFIEKQGKQPIRRAPFWKRLNFH